MVTNENAKTVTGNVTSELTDGKINSLNAMYGKFMTADSEAIAKVTLEKYTKIVKLVRTKISNKRTQDILLDKITYSLIKIFKINEWIFEKSEVDVYESIYSNSVFFNIHLDLPEGISITELQNIVNAKYNANLYWVEVLSFDLNLQFKVTVKGD